MVIMRYTSLPVTVVAVGLFIFNYYSQKDDNLDHYETKSLVQPPQMKETKWENLLTSQQKEDKNPPEKLKPQCKKNSAKLNLEDRPSHEAVLTAVIGSLPLDRAFLLLLIHTCGADLVASISTLCHHMIPGGVPFDLAFTFIVTVYSYYKHQGEKAEWVKKIAHLQKDSLKNKEDREDVFTTLMEVKTELENQRGRLKELLEEVERERDVNRQKRQAVEKEISELVFDKPEELLREKENLLQAGWKLEQTQKDHEGQLLNTEKLLEPIEIQITRTHRNKEEAENSTHNDNNCFQGTQKGDAH